tara:strand:- start:139 stop:1131 length:993 start_codon:yes stop_codon:yes gene_type:complete
MRTRGLVLNARPEGALTSEHVRIVELTVPDQAPLLLQPRYISVDPYMRTRMHPAGYDYIDHWHAGSSLSGWTLAKVVNSHHPGFSAGDWVIGHLPMQEHVASDGQVLTRLAQDVDPKAYLHPLGMTGFTAWVGMHLLGQPNPNDTVLINAAAGAVGSIAAQLAKQAGARIVVTAGHKNKRAWLSSLGFQKVLNHRAPDYHQQLSTACPDGITLNFENVGGDALSAAIDVMRPHGRIILCGLISQYQTPQPKRGPDNLGLLQRKHVPIHPFVVPHFMKHWASFQRDMTQRLSSQQIHWHLDEIPGGLESVAPALIGLLEGDNLGKRIVAMP